MYVRQLGCVGEFSVGKVRLQAFDDFHLLALLFGKLSQLARDSALELVTGEFALR